MTFQTKFRLAQIYCALDSIKQMKLLIFMTKLYTKNYLIIVIVIKFVTRLNILEMIKVVLYISGISGIKWYYI